MVAFRSGCTNSNNYFFRENFNLRQAIKIWRVRTNFYVYQSQQQRVNKFAYSLEFEKKNTNKTHKILNRGWVVPIPGSKFYEFDIFKAGPVYKSNSDLSIYFLGKLKSYYVYDFILAFKLYKQNFVFFKKSEFIFNKMSAVAPIMYVASREDLRKQNRLLADYYRHQHVSVKWLGGILTNSRLPDLRFFIGNVRTHSLSGREMRWRSRKIFRKKMDFPNTLLIWDTHYDEYAVSDGLILKIPLLGFFDNVVNAPRRLIYPFPGQNYKLEQVTFYQDLFRAIFYKKIFFHAKIAENKFLSFFAKNSIFVDFFIKKHWFKIKKKGYRFYFLKRLKFNILKKFYKLYQFNFFAKNLHQKQKFFSNYFFSHVSFFLQSFKNSNIRRSFKIFRSFDKWRRIYSKVMKRKKNYQEFLFNLLFFERHTKNLLISYDKLFRTSYHFTFNIYRFIYFKYRRFACRFHNSEFRIRSYEIKRNGKFNFSYFGFLPLRSKTSRKFKFFFSTPKKKKIVNFKRILAKVKNFYIQINPKKKELLKLGILFGQKIKQKEKIFLFTVSHFFTINGIPGAKEENDIFIGLLIYEK